MPTKPRTPEPARRCSVKDCDEHPTITKPLLICMKHGLQVAIAYDQAVLRHKS